MSIKLFNGRGQSRRDHEGHWHDTGHVYIAAKSIADAVRAMHEAGFEIFTRHELVEYFSKGRWGKQMDDVAPERGVWVSDIRTEWEPGVKPVRII